VFAVLGFACLIVLSKKANDEFKNKEVYFWLENTQSMYFPRFHFRSSFDSNLWINNVSCSFFHTPIPQGPCATYRGQLQPIEYCVAIYADQILVANDPENEFFEPGISCNISTVGNSTMDGQILKFEIEGEDFFGGVNRVYFAPTEHAWILLAKAEILLGKERIPTTSWSKNLAYQSTVSFPGTYRLRIILNEFGVFHAETIDLFNGWMAVGGTGGYAFFMLGIHTLLMIILGLFFGNNSVFLKGSSDNNPNPISSAEYSEIKG